MHKIMLQGHASDAAFRRQLSSAAAASHEAYYAQRASSASARNSAAAAAAAANTYYNQADAYDVPASGGEHDPAAAGVVEDTTPYCLCRRPTCGEMIGCDSATCEIEWFHLDCVRLKAAPTGNWYCPQCTIKLVRGGRERARRAQTHIARVPATLHVRAAPRTSPRRPRKLRRRCARATARRAARG